MTILGMLTLLSLALLALTWAGYPVLVWVLSRFRRAPDARAGAAMPGVTIVIATREAPEAVLARVRNCLESEYDPGRLRVVVAVNRSADPGDEAVVELAPGRVRLIEVPGDGGKAAALNAGVAASMGEVLVFTDTFQRFAPDTVRRLVEALDGPGLAAVSGRLITPESTPLLMRLYWRYETWLRTAEARLHSTVGVTGAVWALRRDRWSPLPAGVLLDDVYAPMRVVLGGGRVGYASDAVAYELRHVAPAREYRRKVRTLTGVIQACAWLPALLSPVHNPIWAQFVIHKLFRLLTPVLLLILVLYALQLTMLLPRDLLLFGAPAGALAAAWVARSRSPRAARLRAVAVEAALLQAAIVMAGVNGVRGRWEVWNG
jgi:poly-beta-1,6-N-acetyl-D-glucosamine synthase